jgi:zinc protease
VSLAPKEQRLRRGAILATFEHTMTAVSAPGQLEDIFAPAAILRTSLSNGLRVIVLRDRSAPVVSIVTYVGAGYFDETDDVVGISHVLEHMYFKGTRTRGVGEIARETKASGGYLNAGTIYHHTHYYTVLPSSGFEAGLAIQADAYANSLIDARELRKELEVIIEEAKRKADSPTALTTETLFALLHDHHRIRRWRMGREAGLRGLTAEQVLRFYRNFYRPSNTVLAVVGDVDPDRAMDLVRHHYGSLPDGNVARADGPREPDPARPAFRYAELAGDIQQTELLFGWRTPGMGHDNTPALDLLAAVLATGRASRLYRAVRERRLASSVEAYDFTPGELGVFVVHASVPPERAGDAARAVWHELRRVREGEITALEVERARRVIHARWLRSVETMDGKANHLARWELFGDWRRGGEYLERLLGTSLPRLAEVASLYLTPERGGLVGYRPVQSPSLARDAVQMRAVLEAAPTQPLAELTRSRRPSPVPGSRAWSLDREEARVRMYRTSAGIPVLVQRRPGPMAHLGWFVRGGAVQEQAHEAGLTMLMTRTSLKGTERRSAQRIAEDAEFLGGVLSAATNLDGFQWTISVPVGRLDDAAELLGDILQRPIFTDEALESERTVALSNLASLRDDMYRWPMRLATEAAWAGHPYGRSVLGTEQSLTAIDTDALRTWYERCSIEAPGVLVVLADIEPDEAAGLAARYFGGLRPASRPVVALPRWPSAMAERTDTRDKAQSALAMLFPGPARDDDARFAAAMIASVTTGLGGRFFDELRDRQSLAYTVVAAPVMLQAAGAFSAYIAMSPEKEEAARRGLLAEFAKLREAPVTERELAQAKTYMLGSWAIRRENGAHVLGDIADAWLFGTGLQELADYEDRVRAVTAQEMLALARKFFDPSCRVEGIVRGAGRKV